MCIVITLTMKISAIFLLVNETSLLRIPVSSWNSCVFSDDSPQIIMFSFRNGSPSSSITTEPMPPSLNWS